MLLAIIGGVGFLWLLSKTKEATTRKSNDAKFVCKINSLKGELKNSQFIFDGKTLRLKNAKILMIRIQSSNNIEMERKIYILCEGDEKFSGDLKHGRIDTNDIFVHNATFWIQSKVRERILNIQFTMSPHFNIESRKKFGFLNLLTVTCK